MEERIKIYFLLELVHQRLNDFVSHTGYLCMLLMMYAIDDNEKCFKQYTPKQRNKNCPAVIARLSNQHTNIFILALQEELNLLFKLHQLLIILIVEVPLAAARHIRERSEGRVVGEPEELMEEGNIVPLRDCLSGVRCTAAACRPCAAHLAPHCAAGEKERRGCLPPSSSLRCGILPCRTEVSSSMGTDWV